jgi:hypothetical protein
MTVLSIVERLHKLANEEANRQRIARDPTCLPCLTTFLENADEQVVRLSMETLYLLAKEEANRQLMATQPGLMASMQRKLFCANLQTKRYALSTYATLQHYVRKSDEQQNTTAEDDDNDEQTEGESNDGSSSGGAVACSSSLSADDDDSSCSSAIVELTQDINELSPSKMSAHGGQDSAGGGVQAAARTVTIIIKDSLDEDDRQILEDALLQIKGVISLLIDIYSQRCVIRTRTAAEPLLRAICSCGVSASLSADSSVAADENANNQNAANQQQQQNSSGGNKQQQQESAEKKSGWFGWGAPSENAVVVQGSNDANQGGWFGRIATSLFG